MGEKKQLLVGTHTDVTRLAGAIAKSIRDQEEVTLCCLGAGAVHVAGKSLAASRHYLSRDKIALRERPYFNLTQIQGEERNTICVSLEPYPMY